MERKSLGWWQVLCAALTVGPAVAAADRSIDDVKEPDKGSAISTWTPTQQWWPNRGNVSTHGYGSKFGMLVFADEMGDKLSELGRVTLIDRCFEYAQADTSATLLWAICGGDVKAFDERKLGAELKADGISVQSAVDVHRDAMEIVGKAKKIGEAVEAAAKDDPGVAAVLELADTARAEWTTYLGKHKDAFARYLALKDGVRSGKSNHKNFAGCWEATQPAFAKLVKATKFPWELSGDYMPGYMAYLVKTPESYITAASFAACAYSVHESGEALFAAASNQPAGGVRVGWRTIALAKALDQGFAPKFAERALSISNMRSTWQRDTVKMEGVNDIAPIMTPAQGTLATVKKDGDVARLAFKGNTVDACLEWKTTNRVQSVSANGDVNYVKTCKKRGKVANQETATEVGSKFAAGLAPGVDVLVVYKFPVVAWKGKKFVAVFGVPVK